MKANMGSTDRALRALAGVVLTGLYVGNVVAGTLGWVVLAIGALMLATSVFAVCPAYIPFGISTTKKPAA